MILITANSKNIKVNFLQNLINILIHNYLINDSKSLHKIYSLLRCVENIRIWFRFKNRIAILNSYNEIITAFFCIFK
ncbi:hypothetical protein SAMN05720487_10582 [Fibrobacter sp. UWT2]|nr:hypothetical protein SAMN05720487_10582 [Fibrobacter sp. UWT2]